MAPSQNRIAYIGPADTLEEALQRLQDHKGFLAADTETVSVQDKHIIGLGLAISPTEAFYFAAFRGATESQHTISPYLQDAIRTLMDGRMKLWFNAPFDLEVLEPLCDVDSMNWQDVSIACRIQAMHNSLDQNAAEYFGIQHQVIRDILPEGKNMLSLDFATVANKCMHDCMVTWMLGDKVQIERWAGGMEEPFTWTDIWGRVMDVTPQMIRAYQTDRKLIPLLRRMGKKGLSLNQDFLRQQYTKLAAEKFRYLDICQQQFGFNPGSNQQTGYVLSERGNFLPWTKTGRYKQLAVSGDILQGLTDPLAYIVLEYRKRADQLSDVIEPLLGKPPGEKGKKVPYAEWQPFDRFTTHFRLDLATSRLASSDRNIQNITPALREMFVPDNGTYTYWDANQIEYRIFGYLSGEPNILNAYREGRNIHEEAMEATWPGQMRWPNGKLALENPLYTDAKTGNYAVIYKVQSNTLAKAMRRPVDFCQHFIDVWRERNPVAVRWQQWAIEDGLQHGWVPTMEGRRCRLPDPVERGEEHTSTCAINYRVQGSAAWPIKLALLQWDEEGYDQRCQLHDEVVCDGDYDFPPDYKLQLGELEVPVEVKHGPHWF